MNFLVIAIFAGDSGGKNLLTQVTPGLYIWTIITCLLYTSPSPRDLSTSRMPSSA